MKFLLQCGRALLVGVGLLVVVATASAGVVGTLQPALFEDQVIVWKSIQDLETAVDIFAAGQVSDGDLDNLLECWADAGTPAMVLEHLSNNQLLRIRLDGNSCEGIIFAEEYAE